MNELELKRRFAQMHIKDPDPFRVALVLFPEDTTKASQIAREWPNDLEVLSIRDELFKTSDPEESLPTKTEFCQAIWEKMHPSQGRVLAEDYVKLGKLYADVRGFIEKPQTNITANVQNVSNKVMIVKESASDDDWAARLQAQQERLVSGDSR